MRHHEKSKLFEGLDDSSASSGVVAGGGETFVPRGDIKKLKIKPKPSQVGTSMCHAFMNLLLTFNFSQ